MYLNFWAYYGNRTEWSASEQSVTIRVIKHKLSSQFIITNTKFEMAILNLVTFFIHFILGLDKSARQIMHW